MEGGKCNGIANHQPTHAQPKVPSNKTQEDQNTQQDARGPQHLTGHKRTTTSNRHVTNPRRGSTSSSTHYDDDHQAKDQDITFSRSRRTNTDTIQTHPNTIQTHHEDNKENRTKPTQVKGKMSRTKGKTEKYRQFAHVSCEKEKTLTDYVNGTPSW